MEDPQRQSQIQSPLPADSDNADNVDNVDNRPRPKRVLATSLAALGIVYGSLATSPLYTLKECLRGVHGVPLGLSTVLGVLSLIFWTLLLVGLKYLALVLRADNHKMGGIMALTALVVAPESADRTWRPRAALLPLGLFTAALLYGDGLLTPVVSVLSAVEGLEFVSPRFHDLVVPLTAGILLGLFLIQRRGAAWRAAALGPLMLAWLVGMAALGAPWLCRHPEVLQAINPYHAIAFLVSNGSQGLRVLGGVVLCVSGTEMLYAGLGSVDRRSIAMAFVGVVMPALVITYFGQGACLLAQPGTIRNPFFQFAPHWALYPLVLGSTVAALVAAQALIWAVFSLTRQAVQLAYWPRVRIIPLPGGLHGQVFVPAVNTVLVIACLALIVAFRRERSAGLAAAFGVAVMGAMTLTGVLVAAVARLRWQWRWRRLGPPLAIFLLIDLGLLFSSLTKVREGGWIPLVIAGILFLMMMTWHRGREALAQYIESGALPLELFVSDLAKRTLYRSSGVAVFLSSSARGIPIVLLHQVKHNKCLHEQVIVLTIDNEPIPEVPESRRISIRELGSGCFQVTARYGFMQTPNVPAVLESCRQAGLPLRSSDVSFYLGRDTILTSGRSDLPRWRKELFALLSRNSNSAADYFGLPPNRVLELGAQIPL